MQTLALIFFMFLLLVLVSGGLALDQARAIGDRDEVDRQQTKHENIGAVSLIGVVCAVVAMVWGWWR